MAATVIAIDAGHGVSTPGKRSPENLGLPVLREYQYNRQNALLLEKALRTNGFGVVMTATTDADSTPATRIRRAVQAGAKLFLSLHANAGPRIGAGTGFEVWHADDQGQSGRLARLVQEDLVRDLQMDDRGTQVKNLWVTRELPPHGIVPVLIELGFMTNADDLARMRRPAFQQKCASAIAKAVCRYVGVQYQPVVW